MSHELTIGDLFRRSPTRELEEVQKVDSTDDRAQAEEDISEFIETESAEEVVARLTDRVTSSASGGPRLLYLHATFGSGKSHLLKLIGLTTGGVPGCEDLADRLAEQFSSFRSLRRAFNQSRPGRWVPIFLNLLDRDPAADPPLPYLIHQALCRRLGYPTEPAWLAEWAWRADHAAGLWEEIEEAEYEGMTFHEVARERAPLRRWLRAVVPELPGAEAAGISTEADVTASIEEAERAVTSSAFDKDQLAERVREGRTVLSRRAGEQVELLLGVDEVALFVGHSEDRFREFRSTVEALGVGERPLVIATGQWSLAGMARYHYGDVPADWMHEDEVKLQAADAEVIVRKRWLAKDPEHTDEIKETLERLRTAVRDGQKAAAPSDQVESYPFLTGDLRHFRQATEEILTAGAEPDREYVQGRALLVYVRSLFTDHEWGSERLGRIVSWDLLFDLLDTQGDYLPEWVNDLLGLVESSVEGEGTTAVRAAKALYLINQAPTEGLRGTAETVARHLLRDVSEDLESLTECVRDVLGQLAEMHLVYSETTGEGTVYRLVSREEVTVSEKIQQHQVTSAQIRVRLEQWVQEDEYCASEDRRREVDLNGERAVPLRTRYSLLSQSVGSSSSAFDTVTVRVLVHYEDVDEAVSRWKSQNEGGDRGSEDVLVVVRLPEAFYTRLDRAIAMQQVLERETRRIRELELKARRERDDLERKFLELLSNAPLHLAGVDGSVGEYGNDFERLVTERVLGEKFPNRRVLERPLRPLDDAVALERFFGGDGKWPLTPADAGLLGVNRRDCALESGGFTDEFFSQYEETQFVNGDRLVDRIEGPGGDLLGTPFETLQALVLAAFAGRRITLRHQGETVLDPQTAARMVRNKTSLERITFRPAPPEDSGRAEEVERLYETLAQESPGDTSPTELLEELSEWARDGLGRVREVDRKLRRGTTTDARLMALEEALSPAESGGELREEDLSEDRVLEEAERFALARRYFGGDLEDLWRDLEDTARVLEQCYPSAPVARQIHRYFTQLGLPEPATARDLLEEARETRRDRLTYSHQVLLGKDPTEHSVDELNRTLRKGLQEQEGHFSEEIETLRKELDRQLAMSELGELLDRLTSAGQEFSPGDVESEELAEDTRTLERAWELARPETQDTSLWEQLSDAVETLEEENPESPLLEQCRRALEAPTLPTPDLVRDLIEQAESEPDEAVEEEEEMKRELPAELNQHLDELDEGAMVAVIEGQS